MISEPKAEEKLLGCWISDPQDLDGIDRFGQVSLEFSGNGRLKYTVHEAGKRQIMFLTYRVERDLLITNQPSAPREEITRFEITPSGKLRLLYEERTSTYVRRSPAE